MNRSPLKQGALFFLFMKEFEVYCYRDNAGLDEEPDKLRVYADSESEAVEKVAVKHQYYTLFNVNDMTFIRVYYEDKIIDRTNEKINQNE